MSLPGRTFFCVSALVFSTSLSGAAMAKDYLIIGGYSDSIGVFSYDKKKGQIDANSRVNTPSKSASWLVVEKKRKLLFAVNELGSAAANNPLGTASSFKIDSLDKPMEQLSQQPTQGDEPTNAAVSPDGKYMFAANYAVHPKPGGSLVVFPIDKDGKLQPLSQKFVWPASKVNPDRQASSHAHQAIMSPDGKFLFECDLGGDKVYTYSYSGDAKDNQPLKHVQTAELPPGSGPRHLAFSENGKYAYLTMEMAGAIGILDRKPDGAMKLRTLIKLASPLYPGKVGAGAIALSDDGKFLYVTNRGDLNVTVVFAVDKHNGNLRHLQTVSAQGKEPRVFRISPNGKYFLVANQFSNEVVTFHRDPKSGLIGDVVQRLPVTGPSMLIFTKD